MAFSPHFAYISCHRQTHACATAWAYRRCFIAVPTFSRLPHPAYSTPFFAPPLPAVALMTLRAPRLPHPPLSHSKLFSESRCTHVPFLLCCILLLAIFGWVSSVSPLVLPDTACAPIPFTPRPFTPHTEGTTTGLRTTFPTFAVTHAPYYDRCHPRWIFTLAPPMLGPPGTKLNFAPPLPRIHMSTLFGTATACALWNYSGHCPSCPHALQHPFLSIPSFTPRERQMMTHATLQLIGYKDISKELGSR